MQPVPCVSDLIASLLPETTRILILGDGPSYGAAIRGADVTRLVSPPSDAASRNDAARFDAVIIDPLELPLGRSARVLDHADRVLGPRGSLVALPVPEHVNAAVAALVDRGYSAVSLRPEGTAVVLAQRCDAGDAPQRWEKLLLESQIALAERDDVIARLTTIRGRGAKLGPILSQARSSRGGRMAWRALRCAYRAYRRRRGVL